MKFISNIKNLMNLEANCTYLLLILFLVGAIFSPWRDSEFITTMLGAFFGAFAAFTFNIVHNQMSINAENKSALVKSKFIITTISSFNEQILNHIKDSQEKNYSVSWRNTSPFIHHFSLLPLNTQHLLFLLDINKKELLKSILCVDAEFESLLNCIKLRNTNYQRHAELVEESLKIVPRSRGIPSSEQFNAEKIKYIIGAVLFDDLEVQTNRIIDLSNKLKQSCDDAIKKLDQKI